MKRLASLACFVIVALVGACETTRGDMVIGTDCDSGFCPGDAPPAFTPSVDASLPDVDTPLVGQCPTNVCPIGRTTCPNKPFPCAVDLTSDNDNCGACDNRCPRKVFPNSEATTTCVDGRCRFACGTDEADCNGFVDDGCEVNLSTDPNNCGGCGIVCKDVPICTSGVCGCRTGFAYCNGRCINLEIDPSNCGVCGNVCLPGSNPDLPNEWHARYLRCGSGQCNPAACLPNWFDCNGDFPHPNGDGCEIDGSEDPKNCGGCGVECAPGEVCSGAECQCPCGSSCFRVDNDIDNCGVCGVECPGDRSSIAGNLTNMDPAHGKPVCAQGVCDYMCSLHWSDCDGNIDNGCETNVGLDPLNCGGCGIRCDGLDGQACVDGRCTTRDCEIVR